MALSKKHVQEIHNLKSHEPIYPLRQAVHPKRNHDSQAGNITSSVLDCDEPCNYILMICPICNIELVIRVENQIACLNDECEGSDPKEVEEAILYDLIK